MAANKKDRSRLVKIQKAAVFAFVINDKSAPDFIYVGCKADSYNKIKAF